METQEKFQSESKEIDEDMSLEYWENLVKRYDQKSRSMLEKKVIEIESDTDNYSAQIFNDDTLKQVAKKEYLRNSNANFKLMYKEYLETRPDAATLKELHNTVNQIVDTVPAHETNSAIYDSYAMAKTNDGEKLRLRYTVSKLEKEFKKVKKREAELLDMCFHFSKVFYQQQNFIDRLKRLYTQKEIHVLKLKDKLSSLASNPKEKMVMDELKE